MSRRETSHDSTSIEFPDADQTPTPSSVVFEHHYSAAEIGSMWNLSEDAVRRLFEKEPGVLVLSNPKRGKRRYRTLRIPETVAQRVHRRLSLPVS